MFKTPAVLSGGVISPADGWPDVLQYSVMRSGEYTMISEGPTPLQNATPSNASATQKALDVYRALYSRPDGKLILGCADYIPLRGVQDQIQAICGGRAELYAFEFETFVSGKQDTLRSAMLAHVQAGGIIGIHDHPNNFATGGNYQDKTGLPVAAIKSGGANHEQYLLYLDDLAAFIASLGDVAVVYRPFHEMNGEWFWWNGVDRAADLVLVWQQTVNYLRVTKGLNNILFSWNLNGSSSSSGATSNATNPYSTWWPGAEYVDLVSMDIYDNGATPTLLRNSYVVGSWATLLNIAITNNSPIYLAEVGSSTGSQAIEGFWMDKVFSILSAYPGCSCLAVWNETWAPSQGTPAAASFSSAVRQYARVI